MNIKLSVIFVEYLQYLQKLNRKKSSDSPGGVGHRFGWVTVLDDIVYCEVLRF